MMNAKPGTPAKVDVKVKGKKAAPINAPQVYKCDLCKKSLSSLPKLQKHIDNNKCKVMKKVNAFCMKEHNTNDVSSVIKKLEEEEEKEKVRVVGDYDCKLCLYSPLHSPQELKFHFDNFCPVVKKRELDKQAIAAGASVSRVVEEEENESNLQPSV